MMIDKKQNKDMFMTQVELHIFRMAVNKEKVSSDI